MAESTRKQEAREIIDRLPDDAMWEDLRHEIYARERIEAGSKDLREGRKVSHGEIRREFGLDES